MFGGFTEDGRQAVTRALEESRVLGHDFIAPEHLLLGAMLAPGAAADALHRLGARESELRMRIVERLGPGGTPDSMPRQIPFLPDAQMALEAARAAHDRDVYEVGTEHLLWGLLEKESIAALLEAVGVPGHRLDEALREVAARREQSRRGPVDPRHPGPPIVVSFDEEILGDLGNVRVDARLLLAILLRDRGVADWLRERGVDEPAVRNHFGRLDLGWEAPPPT